MNEAISTMQRIFKGNFFFFNVFTMFTLLVICGRKWVNEDSPQLCTFFLPQHSDIHYFH